MFEFSVEDNLVPLMMTALADVSPLLQSLEVQMMVAPPSSKAILVTDKFTT